MDIRESCISAITAAKFELDLTRSNCSHLGSFYDRMKRSAVQASRAIVEAVDYGFDELWPTGWWILWAIRFPDDTEREPCKIKHHNGFESLALDFKFGDGLDARGNLTDSALFSIWIQQIGVCLRAEMGFAKANAGDFDWPKTKTDEHGFALDVNGCRIADSNLPPSNAFDDYSPTEAMEHLRNQAADWSDQCAKAIEILRRARFQAKRKGKWAPIETKTWGELDAAAGERVTLQLDRGFDELLGNTADMWVEIVTVDLSEPDPQTGEPTYIRYMKKVVAFLKLYNRLSKAYDSLGDERKSLYHQNGVFDAMAHFGSIYYLMCHGPITKFNVVPDSYVTLPFAIEFQTQLYKDCDENGLDRKPKQVIDFARNLELILHPKNRKLGSLAGSIRPTYELIQTLRQNAGLVNRDQMDWRDARETLNLAIREAELIPDEEIATWLSFKLMRLSDVPSALDVQSLLDALDSLIDHRVKGETAKIYPREDVEIVATATDKSELLKLALSWCEKRVKDRGPTADQHAFIESIVSGFGRRHPADICQDMGKNWQDCERSCRDHVGNINEKEPSGWRLDWDRSEVIIISENEFRKSTA